MSERIKYLLLALLWVAFFALEARAQSPSYLEDEGSSLWQQDSFIESDGSEGLGEGGSGGEYVGDEELRNLEEAARNAQTPQLNLAAQLEKDKELLPDNIIYGLGTGLAMGGWYALLAKKGARENAQYLGGGAVLGLLLGLAVGTKSVYQPLLRGSNDPPQPSLPLFLPVLGEDHRSARAGLSL